MAFKKITAIKIFQFFELIITNSKNTNTHSFFLDLMKEKLFYLMEYLINYDLDFKGMARIARLIERQFTSNDEAYFNKSCQGFYKNEPWCCI